MRIVRYKMKKETRTLLDEAARMHKIETTLAYDLYALLRQQGKGLPTEARIAKMAKSAAAKSNGDLTAPTASMLMRKRRQQLKSMIATVVFKTLSKRKDSIEALRLFVFNFQLLHQKVRQAECVTCKLMSNCEFGKQYSGVVRDIRRVLDPDYAKKAHADCPSLPEIESTNQLASAADAFAKLCRQGALNQLAQNLGSDPNPAAAELGANNPKKEIADVTKAQEAAEAEGEPAQDDDTTEMEMEENNDEMYASSFGSDQAHLGGTYRGSHTGNDFIIQQQLIQRLLVSNLVLFDLGKKFGMALSASKKGKFSPTSKIDKSTTQRNIERVSDVTKLQASQHGLPKEVFDAKLEKRELVKRQDMTQKDKKKLLYLILDVSGSMSGWLGDQNPNKILTRGALAATLMISLVSHVEADGGIVFLRFFADSASNLITARTKEEFERLSYLIANSSFRGGGTDILNTLGHAVKDIQRAKDEIHDAEILAVTDCEDTFDVNSVRATIKGQEFNVLDVSGGQFVSHGASGQLKACANNYYKADEKAVDVDKIVAIV